MSIGERLTEVAGLLERRLNELLPPVASGPRDFAPVPARLAAAMRHAVMGGGKRLRPALVIESAGVCGLAPAAVLDIAAAIECLHCYSLVHDDLPAMDDDALRRGQPTVHVAFDEATAILAGDALQALAFEIMARPETAGDPAIRIELVRGLAEAAGAAGMCGGQQRDMEAEEGAGPLQSIAGVELIQAQKTGALIRFAAEAGAIAAGAPTATRRALTDYGTAIGTAFQIRDDLLDATGDPAIVGKATSKDGRAGKAGKATFVSLLGVSGAERRLADTIEAALAALGPLGRTAAPLASLAHYIGSRDR